MPEQSHCDLVAVVFAMLVFSMPLMLLFPDVSVWDVVPKVRVKRYHIISQEFTWYQINMVMLGLLAFFFCLFLEIRKRKLDDMVEKVLIVSQVADATLEVEQDRQAAAAIKCIELLDASTKHYENLIMLKDQLRRRQKRKQQFPPKVELSSSAF